MLTWHIITGEYPPVIGGVSGYCQLVAEGLAATGDDVHVWCPPLPEVAAPNGVTVHPTLGRISRRDLRAVDLLLDRFPPPRRLLVQWVPHGFGYRSLNVGFCLCRAAGAAAPRRHHGSRAIPRLRRSGGPLTAAAAIPGHDYGADSAARRVWV